MLPTLQTIAPGIAVSVMALTVGRRWLRRENATTEITPGIPEPGRRKRLAVSGQLPIIL